MGRKKKTKKSQESSELGEIIEIKVVDIEPKKDVASDEEEAISNKEKAIKKITESLKTDGEWAISSNPECIKHKSGKMEIRIEKSKSTDNYLQQTNNENGMWTNLWGWNQYIITNYEINKYVLRHLGDDPAEMKLSSWEVRYAVQDVFKKLRDEQREKELAEKEEKTAQMIIETLDCEN